MSKKKIVVIGCSWCRDSTFDGYSWQDGVTFSWPELLAQDLNDEYEILNYGIRGNSNYAILQLTAMLANDLKHEAVCFVIQFTRAFRQTFVKDESSLANLANIKNLIPSRHSCMAQTSYKELPVYTYSDEWKFNEAGFCVAHPGKLENNGGNLRTQYQNNLLYASEFQDTQGHIMTEALQRHAIELCKRNNIPAVAYSHTDIKDINSDHLDFIIERDFKEMHSYVVDNGLHLSAHGNREILDKFIKPCIITKI